MEPGDLEQVRSSLHGLHVSACTFPQDQQGNLSVEPRLLLGRQEIQQPLSDARIHESIDSGLLLLDPPPLGAFSQGRLCWVIALRRAVVSLADNAWVLGMPYFCR